LRFRRASPPGIFVYRYYTAKEGRSQNRQGPKKPLKSAGNSDIVVLRCRHGAGRRRKIFMSDNNSNTYQPDESDFITLEFDDGLTVECEIMGVFDFEGKEYIALIPDDGSDDVYIYGYKEVSDDEFELIDILDDDEFERVIEEFEQLTDNVE
jgi:hypothetical protein